MSRRRSAADGGKDLIWLFTRHPASVGENYAEHLASASNFGVRLVLGGMACLVHAVLPFLFTFTGSNAVDRLYQEMVVRRRNGIAGTAPVSGARHSDRGFPS
jgi:Family of unknown function (DUF6356)